MSPRKKKVETQSDRIVAALTTDASELRDRATTALIEFVLDQPIATWLDLEDAVELIVASATGPNSAVYIERHVRPGWDRYIARCQATGDTLGAALPSDVRRRVLRLVVETPPPRAAWADDAVDPKLVRKLFAPVLQEFLLGFARGLPIPGIGGSSEDSGGSRSGFGLRSRLKQSVEKRAEKFVEAGKSVLGGLGAEMERQIQSVAKDFSESAGRDLRKAFVDRLKSAEGKALANQIVTQAIEHVLDTPIAELNRDSESLPWDDIWALVPPVVEHNRERAPIVDAVREEIAAVVELDGPRTLRDVLEEAGTLDLTVAKAFARADAPVRAFFAGEGFRGWLDAALEV